MSSKPRILFIEDESYLRRLYQEAFGEKYQTVLVEKSEDAIPHLAGIDVIVSDWEQPNSKGGKGLLDYLAREKIKKPVIIVSGKYLDPEDYSGAKAYIQKPISLDELETAIKHEISQ